jgi:phosphoribosylamine--glycine ligase
MECPTFGDGSFESELEDNREFGIKAMEACNINVPPYQRFDTAAEAKAFLKTNDRPYVYKPFESPSGNDDKALTYVAKSAQDLIECIDHLWNMSKHTPFILQEFIKGEELGVAGYFNGENFYLLTGTLEEKKFMNDNKGPNTGCSGNLVFAMNDDMKIYKEGLEKAIPFLRDSGFRGIIDLNTIITEDNIYGLEWTPRFGYVSDPTIATMYGSGFGDMLCDISSGKAPELKWGGGTFGSAVTISIPPYPTEVRLARAKEIPIEGIDPSNIDDLLGTYLYDVKLDGKKKLETSGNFGYIGAVLGASNSISNAFAITERKLKNIHVPNMQYRTDIQKSTTRRYEQIQDWGWL